MWIRGPGIDPGQSVTTPVLTIDLAPTLLDLAGVVQKYDDMDGLTLTPLLIKNNTVDHNNTSVNVGSVIVVYTFFPKHFEMECFNKHKN